MDECKVIRALMLTALLALGTAEHSSFAPSRCAPAGRPFRYTKLHFCCMARLNSVSGAGRSQASQWSTAAFRPEP